MIIITVSLIVVLSHQTKNFYLINLGKHFKREEWKIGERVWGGRKLKQNIPKKPFKGAVAYRRQPLHRNQHNF